MEPHDTTAAVIDQLRRLSTCLVASAIETFQVRLPNTGFADSGIRCIFPDMPPMVGYAATLRIRSASPPMQGYGYHYARSDWWNHVLAMPAPRVVIIEDLDDPPGLGAFVGEVNANILRSIGCVGLVTNGGVRDVNEVRSIGFPLFAGNVCVSHAYSHVYDFGGPVVVGGLEVRPGDLIQGDAHGVQTVPLEIASKIPGAAREIQQRRWKIVSLCQSPDFSIDGLREAVNGLEKKP